jgi:Fe-S cluster assembly protein SufD
MNSEYSAFGYNRGDGAVFTQFGAELKNTSVVFKDLYSAAREDNAMVERHFGRLIGYNFGKFEALNMALWNNGLYLYIPANTVIEKPIYLHRHPTGMTTMSRLLVIAGENSQATIIDDYACHCHHDGAIGNSAVEIVGGASSNVRYVNIQRLAEGAKTYITERAEIGASANIKSIFGSVGSAITKVNAGVVLNSRGASSQIYGVVFGNAKQHFDYHTTQHHKSGESFSNLNFKVVLKEKAMSAYTGLIRIEKDAANCEAYQENRNLLLSKGTKAESIPELEILTDEVRCTHGATMGPIDPEMVFYLKSRGIDEAEAIRSIVSGFIEPLLVQIPADIAEILRNLVHVKLGGEVYDNGVR